MNKQQSNKLAMYRSVKEACTKNESVWSNLTAFSTAFGDFTTKLAEFESVSAMQQTAITGHAREKSKARAELVNKALPVAKAAYAYAETIEDSVLQRKFDITRSSLMYGRFEFALNKCIMILSEVDGLATELADFGISQETLDDLRSEVDVFKVIIASPRLAITERKGLTEQLSNLLDEIDGILKRRMDPLIEQFRISNSMFFNLYFSQRSIVDRGIRSIEDTGERGSTDQSPFDEPLNPAA